MSANVSGLNISVDQLFNIWSNHNASASNLNSPRTEQIHQQQTDPEITSIQKNSTNQTFFQQQPIDTLFNLRSRTEPENNNFDMSNLFNTLSTSTMFSSNDNEASLLQNSTLNDFIAADPFLSSTAMSNRSFDSSFIPQSPNECSIGQSILSYLAVSSSQANANSEQLGNDEDFLACQETTAELQLNESIGIERNTPNLFDKHAVAKCGIDLHILDDLATRFIVNMPLEEKNDLVRILFQLETAFWHYQDFICEECPTLPRLKLKKFAYVMFNHIPRLRKYLVDFDVLISSWMDYKFSVPTSGVVLLNETMDFVLLVQGQGSKTWGFPKGKMNKDESFSACAIREVSYIVSIKPYS